VGIRLVNGENISAVIQGFMDVFDVPQVRFSIKLIAAKYLNYFVLLCGN
jgi:hypothetical protein